MAAFARRLKAVSRKQDASVRQMLDRVWSKGTESARLEALNSYTMPYKATMTAALRNEMLSAWRWGQQRGKEILAASTAVGSWVKRRYAEGQEMAGFSLHQWLRSARWHIQGIAEIQEFWTGDNAPAEIASMYEQWANRLGEELWQQKVRDVKDVVSRGIQQGWTLNQVGHYEKVTGERTSAYEATGGRGGRENVISGYRYVVDNKGVRNEMATKLEKYSIPGWHVDRIARTEHTRAMNDGMLSLYESADTVVAVEFDAIIDMRTCPECAMMHGIVMDLSDPRLRWYEPPIHPNCRCELLPVFAWEMEEANLDTPRETTLYDRGGKAFKVEYTPSRIRPDFLSHIRPANDAAGIKRQLMTLKEAETYRKGFTAPGALERFAAWMHPTDKKAAKALVDLLRGEKEKAEEAAAKKAAKKVPAGRMSMAKGKWYKDPRYVEIEKSVIEATKGFEKEACQLIDVSTGKPMMKVPRVGAARQINDNLYSEVRALVANGKYRNTLFLHTHPSSGAFSQGDLGFWFWHRGALRHIGVVGKNGTRYLLSMSSADVAKLSRHTTQINLMVERMNDVYARSYSKYWLKYHNAIEAGKMTKEVAWIEHSHEIMQNVVKRMNLDYGLHLKYSRVMP